MTRRPVSTTRSYRRLPLLIAAITIVILLIGTIGLQRTKTILVTRSGETLALAAADVADRLDHILFERYGDIQMMARAFQGRDPAGISAYLDWMKNAYPYYSWIGVTDSHGTIIASTGRVSLGQDRSGAAWFQDARIHQRVVVQDVQAYEETDGALAVAFTAPLMNASGQFKGVVTSRVSLPVLEDVFRRMVLEFEKQHGPETRYEYIYLTGNGDVIVDSVSREEGRTNLKQLGLPSALRVTNSDQPGYVQEESPRRKEPILTGYARTKGFAGFPSLNWGVLIRVAQDEALAPIHRLLMKIVMAALLVVTPMVGLLFWISGRLRKEWLQTRRSETWLFTTLSSIGDAVIATDRAGSITFMNPVAESMTGWKESDAKGTGLNQIFRIVNEQTRLPVENPADKVLETGLVVGLANHSLLIAKDGRERPIDDSGAPITTDEGTIIGAVLVFRDISDRKEAERLVRNSRDLYLSLFETFPALIWRSGVDAKMDYFNRTWLTFTGRAFEQEQGDGWVKGVHPDDLDRCVNAYLKAFYARQSFEMVYRLRRYDGEYRYVLDHGTPYDDLNGQFGGYIGSCYDVTDQREAEQRLRESERLLAKAQELAHLGSWTWDVAENKGTWSEELCRIVGINPEECDGTYQEYLKWVYPDDRGIVEGTVANALRSDKPFKFSHRIRRRDGGERILHSVGEVILDATGQAVRIIGAAQDVTELKQAEESLRVAHDELERRVHERTSQLAEANEALQRKIDDLEKFEEVVVGRELKMIQLEKEIQRLKAGQANVK